GGIAGLFAGTGDGGFQVVQQAVEVHRHARGHVDRVQAHRVVQPAAREVPAALGAGAQLAVDLGGRAVGGGRGLAVLDVRLRARRVAVVPVAVEQAAV